MMHMIDRYDDEDVDGYEVGQGHGGLRLQLEVSDLMLCSGSLTCMLDSSSISDLHSFKLHATVSTPSEKEH